MPNPDAPEQLQLDRVLRLHKQNKRQRPKLDEDRNQLGILRLFRVRHLATAHLAEQVASE